GCRTVPFVQPPERSGGSQLAARRRNHLKAGFQRDHFAAAVWGGAAFSACSFSTRAFIAAAAAVVVFAPPVASARCFCSSGVTTAAATAFSAFAFAAARASVVVFTFAAAVSTAFLLSSFIAPANAASASVFALFAASSAT